MFKKRKSGFGGKGGILYWGVALAGLALLCWMGLGLLDWEEPFLKWEPEPGVVGPKATFTLKAGDQGSGLKDLRVTVSQDGQEREVHTRAFPPGAEPGASVEVPFTVDSKALGLKEGKARLTASVRDRSWRNWFQGRRVELSREVDIDLVPLTLTFQGVNHLLHSGGTGLILYRLNKPAKESGVISEGRLYAGYPNPKGAKGDYAVLFPVPREAVGVFQVDLTARPLVGEEVRQRLPLKVKSRRWRQDKMNLSEDFLRKVAATFPVSHPGDLLGGYLEVNRELRRKNHEQLRQLCAHSRPTPLWTGAFQRYLGKPMARFGDKRTYVYQGRSVDQQTHLGEDLANLERTPVPASNHGVVVLAGDLGIYGRTVLLDHGMGVFSMYSHLSQEEVKTGQEVKKGAVVGRTGTTGLAGGDHLHFSVLVQGDFVDPLEWWDAHWLKDQVEGMWAKADALKPASGEAAAAAAPKKAGKGKKKPAKGKAKPGKGKKSRQ